MFSGLKNGGYLVEASLSIEERDLRRGDSWTYWYGVKQRQKEISGSVTRIVQIPFDSNIKGKASKPFSLSMSTHHCRFVSLP